jgi:hypothetical protein
LPCNDFYLFFNRPIYLGGSKVIIKNDLSKNRVLLALQEELMTSNSIITRFLWKTSVDQLTLQLLVDQGDGTSYTIQLDGEVFLEFGNKHCLNCGEIIPRTSSEAICDACRTEIFYLCRRCIFDGPGKPFGTTCSPDDPPCKQAWRVNWCWNNHYLYVGRFGNGLKVGTSNCKRKEGRYYRLMEQGLEEAVVLQRFPSLEAVLTAEDNIADQCRLRTYFTFVDKIRLLTEGTNTEESINLHNYAETLAAIYPDLDISIVDLVDLWPKFDKSWVVKKISFPNTIEGKIVYARGNLLLVQPRRPDSSKLVYAYNLRHLVGYEVFTNGY